VLICFFLPWAQVSCAGAKDTLSGFNLARQDDPLLWLIPLGMGAVLVYGLVRYRRANTKVFGLLSAVCGAVVVILLNRERGRAQNDSGLLATQLTGWFWLAFISAIVIVTTAVTMLLRRRRTPEN
jgi:hypothetical protein